MQYIFTHRYFIIGLLLVLSIVSLADIIVDHHEGVGWPHMLQEGFVLALCVVAVANLMFGLRAQQRSIKALKAELRDAHVEVQKASEALKEGRLAFSKVIVEQFDSWLLSKSEKEVGWLLLKGLSLAEIASIRETQEKTVRQQASALYKKAGLSGRHAFAAWFFEDYL